MREFLILCCILVITVKSSNLENLPAKTIEKEKRVFFLQDHEKDCTYRHAVIQESHLYSPDFPELTPITYPCFETTEHYNTNRDLKLEMTCSSFDVYKTKGCSNDYVWVTDGQDESERKCGKKFGYFISSTGQITVKYSSYANYNAHFISEGGVKNFKFNCTIKATPKKRCECGQDFDTRIGEDELLPWQALVFAGVDPRDSATLISSSWLITAALFTRLETAYFVAFGRDAPRKPVKEIIIHEDFQGGTFVGTINDLALLRIEPLQEYYMPACLPFQLQTINFGGSALYMKLTEATSPRINFQRETVISREECIDSYPDGSFPILSNMMCTIPEEPSGPCILDRNNGLMWRNDFNQRHYLIAVLTYKLDCGVRDFLPEVYHRVVSFLPWIIEKTGEEFCKAPPFRRTFNQERL